MTKQQKAEIKERYHKKKERTAIIAYKMGLSCSRVNSVIQHENCRKYNYVNALTMEIYRAIKAIRRFDIKEVQLLTDATELQAKNTIKTLKSHGFVKRIGWTSDKFAKYLVVEPDKLHKYIENLKIRRS